MGELTAVLNAGAGQLGLEFTGEQLEQFEKFYRLLDEANNSFNLTAITGEREAAIKHFLDSLTCQAAVRLNDGIQVVDIGTGAGFPGLPLKICWPGIMLTLVESLEKRVRFLTDVVALLGLKETRVIHARAEDFCRDKKHRERYDLSVARAVAGLPVLAEYCLPAVKVGGLFVAMKGPNVENETTAAKSALAILGGVLEDVINFRLPLVEDERNLVMVRKVGPTPAKYPRRAGIPQKKPITLF
ncbi:MAG: 16S rRNA (guanine(527)-N(7))-methyltransferase RsmG [Desulfotomaculaceae bacterium]|nr:16S rRNA (guanine(527)-N(7))-methyltransferase RsmG [Desulfotomaculaceae bacterium]